MIAFARQHLDDVDRRARAWPWVVLSLRAATLSQSPDPAIVAAALTAQLELRRETRLGGAA